MSDTYDSSRAHRELSESSEAPARQSSRPPEGQRCPRTKVSRFTRRLEAKCLDIKASLTRNTPYESQASDGTANDLPGARSRDSRARFSTTTLTSRLAWQGRWQGRRRTGAGSLGAPRSPLQPDCIDIKASLTRTLTRRAQGGLSDHRRDSQGRAARVPEAELSLRFRVSVQRLSVHLRAARCMDVAGRGSAAGETEAGGPHYGM